LPVAPEIAAQLAPLASHRSHWKWKEVGLPFHVPRVANRVTPTSAVPEIVGGDFGVGLVAAAACPLPG
jgi:hypothetical protein